MRADNSLRRKRSYEFDNFQLDMAERVLRSAGNPISVTPKALDLLIVLVENRGHIVAKEDLMRQVWPDTFVEENTLAFNVSVLRKLFGESSTAPRYIETVPKRGYRFIAEVNEMSENGWPRTPSSLDQSMDGTQAVASGTGSAPRRASKLGTLARLAIVLGAGLAVAAIVLFTLRVQARRKLTDRDTIVFADFVNRTGDPVFDKTLRQGIIIQLEQSPFLSLVSDQRIRHTLRLMSQPADAPLTAQVARDLCKRTGSAALLEGSIASLGSDYVLSLRAENCANGEVLDDQQVQVRRKEEVLNAVTRIARRFRSRMGESPPSLKQHDMPLIEVTTPSLEALQAYTASIRVGYARGCAASVPYGRLAVELDPKFAMAHSHLGRCYSNLGEFTLAAESTIRAYELRDRASDRERFYISTNYDRQVLGNLQKAQATCELWAHTYPRDAVAHGTLSGVIYQGTGRYQQAIEEAEKTIEIDPYVAPAYVAAGFANCYLDRVKEAGRILAIASERGLDTPDLLLLRYYIAFLKSDEPGMERAAALAMGRAGAEDSMSHSQALFLARRGQLRGARRLSRRAVDLALQAGQGERAATYETGSAVWEAFFGNASVAKQSATQALARSQGRDVEYAAAFALALGGECSRSQALANDLEKRFPEDTFVRFSYLPALRGLLALNRGEPAEALRQLQTAAPDELAVPGISMFAFFGGLYPAYVRGEAYLALHQQSAAIAEFQKILDHRGIVLADPAGAMARLQLARTFAMAGNKDKAKLAYKGFLALWRNADSDIPILQRAKAEYQHLQP